MYDCVVVGVGGVGSAALYYLSKLADDGSTVLGVEQFAINHDLGSSADYSRITRTMYDHADYIPMTKEAMALWPEIESDTGAHIYTRCGALQFGVDAKGIKEIEHIRSIAEQEGVPVETFQGAEAGRRFPQFTLPDNAQCVFDPTGGFLNPKAAIGAFVQSARAKGVQIRENCRVSSATRQEDGFYRLELEDVSSGSSQTIIARSLILTAGAWGPELLHQLTGRRLPLTITQEQVNYVHMDADPAEARRLFSPSRFPTFLYEGERAGIAGAKGLYGLPSAGEHLPLKIATHFSGDPIDPRAPNRNTAPQLHICQTIREFCAKYIPAAERGRIEARRCLYTRTPDCELIVDSCASMGHGRVFFFAGSGQGYKFTAWVGKTFAECAMEKGLAIGERRPQIVSIDRDVLKE